MVREKLNTNNPRIIEFLQNKIDSGEIEFDIKPALVSCGPGMLPEFKETVFMTIREGQKIIFGWMPLVAPEGE